MGPSRSWHSSRKWAAMSSASPTSAGGGEAPHAAGAAAHAAAHPGRGQRAVYPPAGGRRRFGRIPEGEGPIGWRRRRGWCIAQGCRGGLSSLSAAYPTRPRRLLARPWARAQARAWTRARAWASPPQPRLTQPALPQPSTRSRIRCALQPNTFQRGQGFWRDPRRAATPARALREFGSAPSSCSRRT